MIKLKESKHKKTFSKRKVCFAFTIVFKNIECKPQSHFLLYQNFFQKPVTSLFDNRSEVVNIIQSLMKHSKTEEVDSEIMKTSLQFVF